MRRLYTRDELEDNFTAVITVLVNSGLWSSDVRTAVAALGAGFGLRLDDLPPAPVMTTLEATTSKSPPRGTFQSEPTRAELWRTFCAFVHAVERIER